MIYKRQRGRTVTGSKFAERTVVHRSDHHEYSIKLLHLDPYRQAAAALQKLSRYREKREG